MSMRVPKDIPLAAHCCIDYSSRMAAYDSEDYEPGALVIVALLVGLPVLLGTLLYLVANAQPALRADRNGYAFAGAVAGFVIGAVVRHFLIRPRR